MDGLGTALLADLVAIMLLAYVAYFRRYHRRDLLLAYVTLNLGVFLVTALLSDAGTGLGLGLGLFGILSIIRLRSDSVTQAEVAYYFAALALGLANGLHPSPLWLSPALSAVLVTAMFVVDHPRLLRGTRRQVVTLDSAYPDEDQLEQALTQLLGADVKHVIVLELDLVRDTTVVDVRFRVSAGRRTDFRVSPLRRRVAARAAAGVAS